MLLFFTHTVMKKAISSDTLEARLLAAQPFSSLRLDPCNPPSNEWKGRREYENIISMLWMKELKSGQKLIACTRGCPPAQCECAHRTFVDNLKWRTVCCFIYGLRSQSPSSTSPDAISFYPPSNAWKDEYAVEIRELWELENAHIRAPAGGTSSGSGATFVKNLKWITVYAYLLGKSTNKI